MMASLFPAALFLIVTAITPGPNNLLVMRTASRNGWRGALPAIVGVVAGGLALLGAVIVGAGSAFITWPALRSGVEAGGVLYLVWLGVRLFAEAGRETSAMALRAGFRGLFVFQFLNPKGWVMVLTVVAAMPATGTADTFLHLAPLFVCIPSFCLLLWAALGDAVSRHLSRAVVRTWTDRILGALLIVTSLLLV
jgi:threonine/homoserine/homoserine lactone efflux protein